MKKIVMLTILLFSLFIGHTSASDNLKVYLFDELVDMENPVIVNGNTLVPLRVLFESLGASITWNDRTQTITAKKGDINLFIQIGNNTVLKNGSAVTLEEPAAIINEKTYVPLRFVAESFNQDVQFDKDNYAVHIGKAMTAKDISKIAAPAVVYIEATSYSDKFYTASGFIIDKSGIVVTNYHVIDNMKSISVKLIDGRSFAVASVLNYDVNKDLATLKINSNIDFPTVVLGDSAKIETGDKVFTIGSPKSYENTISEGIISNKNQFFLNQPQIQITAQIDHGSSGGALFNTKGQVIGITDGGRPDSTANLNFAIPINTYKNMDQNNLNLSLDQVYNNEHVIHYKDATYSGDKKNNVPNGFGIMKFNNGDQYTGGFIDGQRSGKGKYTWTNGASYDGDWVNGLKQGIGTGIDQNGIIFEGQFSNDLVNGKGKVTFTNGDVFYCDFLNGLENGYGTYYYANGTTSRNLWSNGKIIQ